MNSLQPILLVEDDAVDIMTIKRCFKQLNITNELLVATNGKMAFDILLNAIHPPHPCLVILDINMPIMDGISATKKIIEKYGNQRPAIVAMTANVFQEDRDKCKAAGMDDFIAKPIDISELVRVLSKYEKPIELMINTELKH